LYRYGIHGGGESTLQVNGASIYGEMPAALPGGRIVYRVIFPEKGLAVVNDDGFGSEIVLADDTATRPAVSPDGQTIAFMSRRDGNWEIYRMQLDGSGLRRLTENAANDGLPVWSPDGRSIAFASNRGGPWAIWVMNANGNNQRQLFALPGSLDGRVAGEPDYASRGWEEESLAWR